MWKRFTGQQYSKIKYYLCKEHLGKKKENDINRRTDGGIRREAIV